MKIKPCSGYPWLSQTLLPKFPELKFTELNTSACNPTCRYHHSCSTDWSFPDFLKRKCTHLFPKSNLRPSKLVCQTKSQSTPSHNAKMLKIRNKIVLQNDESFAPQRGPQLPSAMKKPFMSQRVLSHSWAGYTGPLRLMELLHISLICFFCQVLAENSLPFLSADMLIVHCLERRTRIGQTDRSYRGSNNHSPIF